MKSQCGMCQDDMIMLGGQEPGETRRRGMSEQPQSCLSLPGVGELKRTSILSLTPSDCSASVAIAYSTFTGIL